MTFFKFAIARAYKQLADASAQRPLTKKEQECLLVCADGVERYAAEERPAK